MKKKKEENKGEEKRNGRSEGNDGMREKREEGRKKEE